MDNKWLKSFLDENYERFNQRAFIENDPISIPHRFSKKEDIEISGFLAATIAWGQRKSIISNADKLMRWMGESPYDFIMNHKIRDLKPFEGFVHRTFNGRDCLFFIQSLRHIYKHHGGLESAFAQGDNMAQGLHYFRKVFLETAHMSRSEKHLADPLKKSSAKRLCMYARWMVRRDKKGVDFGIWNSMKADSLCLPLDVHTGNISRRLGLLKRKQNDWAAVEEVTAALRYFDSRDPVKYDFALFGIGVNRLLD